jgi:hypothetical protein
MAGRRLLISLVVASVCVGLALPCAASIRIGNELTTRSATSDGASGVFYTNFVPMPNAGTVDSVSIYSRGDTRTFNMFLIRPTGTPNEYTVEYDSGTITPPPVSNVISTLSFPNGPADVIAGDLFAHFGRGIPYSGTGGTNANNIQTIFYPVNGANITGTITLPSANFPDNSTIPSRVRDYAWAVEWEVGIIPEPSTLLIWSLLAGLGIGAGWRRRKR